MTDRREYYRPFYFDRIGTSLYMLIKQQIVLVDICILERKIEVNIPHHQKIFFICSTTHTIIARTSIFLLPLQSHSRILTLKYILLNNQNVIDSQLKSTGVVEIPMNPVVAVISYILPHKLEH